MRNDLLSRIVTAAGGVITDKDNRNQLLQDWLNAADSEPVINYVARPDGFSQYWVLETPIEITPEDTVTLGFKSRAAATSEYMSILGRYENYRTELFLWDNGTYKFYGTLSVDSIPFIDELTPQIADGEYHEFEVVNNRPEGYMLSILGAAWVELDVSAFRFYDEALFNLKVVRGGVTRLEIPLTNKEQGATQLATVGDNSATMANYSSDVWEVK